MFRKTILTLGMLLASSMSCYAQQAAADPMRDIKLGMQGLQQMGEDPVLLAQLMRDMQVST
jgi:hypothetical protein